jgi:hypothetical protein
MRSEGALHFLYYLYYLYKPDDEQSTIDSENWKAYAILLLVKMACHIVHMVQCPTIKCNKGLPSKICGGKEWQEAPTK